MKYKELLNKSLGCLQCTLQTQNEACSSIAWDDLESMTLKGLFHNFFFFSLG